jgi:hypothetical protein
MQFNKFNYALTASHFHPEDFFLFVTNMHEPLT